MRVIEVLHFKQQRLLYGQLKNISALLLRFPQEHLRAPHAPKGCTNYPSAFPILQPPVPRSLLQELYGTGVRRTSGMNIHGKQEIVRFPDLLITLASFRHPIMESQASQPNLHVTLLKNYQQTGLACHLTV